MTSAPTMAVDGKRSHMRQMRRTAIAHLIARVLRSAMA